MLTCAYWEVFRELQQRALGTAIPNEKRNDASAPSDADPTVPIGGIRDLILVRDAYLLKGLLAFGLMAWVAFPVIGLVAGGYFRRSLHPGHRTTA